MNINLDTLEEIKELLEHAMDRHSWPAVEDALLLLKEELGYDTDAEAEDELMEE
jgi:hypothetical protein